MDPKQQYLATKNTAVLFDFSSRGKLKVRGSDRISFLNSILTHDIKNLKTGNGCYAALLTAPAKVLADMNVYVFEDHVLLDVEAGVEAKLAGLLDKYIITEDVTIENTTPQTAHFSVEGPQAEAVLHALTGNKPPLKEFEHFKAGNIEVIKRSFTGLPAYQILTGKDTSKIIREGLAKAGAVQTDLDIWEILRIEGGWLRYGIDMDEEISLPETGLDDIAASETKGCYPGQEVVARTKTYKGLRRKITKFIFVTSDKRQETKKNSSHVTSYHPPVTCMPERGSEIYSQDGNAIGKVTSAEFIPGTDKGAGIGLIEKGFFDSGIEILVETREGKIKAQTK